MTVDSWIRVIAGSFILISLALGAPVSPLSHSVHWLWFTAFVGANLFQYGITGFCPMVPILNKLGVRPGCA
jgi:hypothetical protein